MKQKYVAMILTAMLCSVPLSSATVMASEGTEAAEQQEDNDTEEKDEAVWGEVVSISAESVVINVGTRTEDGEGRDSGLELTGEQQEIKITDNTVITKNGRNQPGGGQGEKPDGEMPDGEVPEKPDGEKPDGEMPDGEVPEKPDGEMPDGEMPDGEAPEKPDGEMPDGEMPDGEIPEGEVPEKPDGEGGTENLAWEDIEEGDTISVTLDEDGNADTISVMSMNGGGPGGQPGGGTFYGWDLEVETQGESSAAIRSERGGGTMVIDGGTYTSNGIGSPSIYCTADIAVNNAELNANASEAVCIEGLNSLHLYGCQVTGNMGDSEQNDCTWNVILYQSMSGDSEVGNSTFEMDGGTLAAKNGGMFYTTNTESTITLSNVDIEYSDDNPFFLQCTGNHNQRGWGQQGANGADCLFTASVQNIQGNIIWDSISTLNFYLTEGSELKGAFIQDETYAEEGGDGFCDVYISEDSVWKVTGDSTVTHLWCAGTILDDSGNTVTIQGQDGTVYEEGTGSYTITVEEYEASADLSGASQKTSYEEYETEKPEQLV